MWNKAVQILLTLTITGGLLWQAVLPALGAASLNTEHLQSELFLAQSVSQGDSYSVSENSSDRQPMVNEGEKTVGQDRTDELLEVIVPTSFQLTLDPYKLTGREQIYSQDVILENHSSYAVTFSLQTLECSMPKEDAKACELYLYRNNADAPYHVSGTTQTNVDTIIVPGGEQAVYTFRGSIKEGSEALWKAGDVSVKLIFHFKRTAQSDKE